MGKPDYFGKKVITPVIFLCLIIGGFFYFRYLEKERRTFKVVFMNVGQGDAALINFDDGQKILVDCGPDRGILSALGRNTAFYDRTIDYLIVTHPDLDHYGGCIDVLKNYDVKKVLVNGDDKKGDPFYVEWKTALLKKEVEVASTSTIISIDSARFVFFLPDRTLPFKKIDTNDNSIVFRLQHGRESFLFTGDIGIEAEELLVNKYCAGKIACPLHSDVLKVAHHGSDGSSGESFLAKVAPRRALISVGKNKFGHPSLRATRHLERAGAEISRTDEAGDIIIK